MGVSQKKEALSDLRDMGGLQRDYRGSHYIMVMEGTNSYTSSALRRGRGSRHRVEIRRASEGLCCSFLLRRKP